ncbi:MAG: hypothetical protein MUF00_19275 [Gemmatimonadaceae bacterium]|jgi:hypothetical protein|nr:hypothetical protein [Gemmatimonadaceae bacterium]
MSGAARTAGAVVASALCIGALVAYMKTRPPSDAVVGAGVPAIEMAPVQVTGDSLRFTWTSVGAGARYRVEFLGADGAAMGAVDVTDTSALVARATVGAATSWWVKATDAAGRARLSDVRAVPR